MVSNLVYQLGFRQFQFSVRGEPVGGGACAHFRVDLPDADSPCGRSKKSGCTDMAKPLSHRMLSWAGRAAVVAILGFIILPAIVVGIAAFNDKALLSFPPAAMVACAGSTRRVSYRDFQTGFHNGLIVMLASSLIALVVGAAFAFVLDRYDFRAKRPHRGPAAGAAGGAAFHGRARLSDPGGADRRYRAASRSSSSAMSILVLPFVLRSVYISLRNLDQRLELAAASLGASPARVHRHRDAAAAACPACSAAGCSPPSCLSTNSPPRCSSPRSARRRLPVAMYNYVREYADPDHGGLVCHLHRGDGNAADHRQCVSRPRKGAEC